MYFASIVLWNTNFMFKIKLKHPQSNLSTPKPKKLPTALLQRVRAGIKRVQAIRRSPPARIRLPITPALLDKLRAHWEEASHPDKLALWAASTLCFAEFFRLGELLPSSESQPTPQFGRYKVGRCRGGRFAKPVDG